MVFQDLVQLLLLEIMSKKFYMQDKFLLISSLGCYIEYESDTWKLYKDCDVYIIDFVYEFKSIKCKYLHFTYRGHILMAFVESYNYIKIPSKVMFITKPCYKALHDFLETNKLLK